MTTLPPMVDSPSPNFGERKHGKRVLHLVLHYTETDSGADALALMQNPAHQAAAHYMVDADGTVYRLISEDMRAWHAGKSWWEGEEDVNSTSIGIEVQNGGHSRGLPGFPDRQISAVAALCQDIIARHDILPHHVLGHSDIAPARKTDPGEMFPWRTLAARGVGLMPDTGDIDEAEAEKLLAAADGIRSMLVKYGYDPRVDAATLITQFHRHFCPEKFTRRAGPAAADIDTAKTVLALYRKKLAARRRA